MDIVVNDKTKQALRDAGIAVLYFFGSRAQGHNHPFSDFDFGVLLNDPAKVFSGTLESYHVLYRIIEEMIQPETLEADVIDIIFLDSPHVPLELKSHILRTGHVLFNESESLRADFTARILLQTADFAPLRKQMSEALINRPSV